MSGLVQPILVTKDDPVPWHEDVVRAAATASAMAFATLDGPWDEWLAGPFTKTVRRIASKDLPKARAAAECVCAIRGTTIALAFAPMPLAEFPKALARAQVAGTDFERSGDWGMQCWPSGETAGLARVLINPDVAMTTGKTAAQVAHGWLAYTLREDLPHARSFVVRPDIPFSVDAPVVIHDAGHTEIEPGTCTVKVLPPQQWPVR